MKLSCALEKEFEPFLFQMWETFLERNELIFLYMTILYVYLDIGIIRNIDYKIISICLTNKIMLQNLMLQLTDVRIRQLKNLSDKEYEKSCNHVFHWGYEN